MLHTIVVSARAKPNLAAAWDSTARICCRTQRRAVARTASRARRHPRGRRHVSDTRQGRRASDTVRGWRTASEARLRRCGAAAAAGQWPQLLGDRICTVERRVGRADIRRKRRGLLLLFLLGFLPRVRRCSGRRRIGECRALVSNGGGRYFFFHLLLIRGSRRLCIYEWCGGAQSGASQSARQEPVSVPAPCVRACERAVVEVCAPARLR